MLSLVTHVPGPTWRAVLSAASAMAGGKSTYLERERGEGGREEGIRVGGWVDRPTWTNKGVSNIHNCTEDHHKWWLEAC